MTVDQLSCIKRWQVGHRHGHPMEYQAWDLALTAWVMGLMGLPVAAVLESLWVGMAALGLASLPSIYVAVRRNLHRTRRLRCDWLDAAQPVRD